MLSPTNLLIDHIIAMYTERALKDSSPMPYLHSVTSGIRIVPFKSTPLLVEGGKGHAIYADRPIAGIASPIALYNTIKIAILRGEVIITEWHEASDDKPSVTLYASKLVQAKQYVFSATAVRAQFAEHAFDAVDDNMVTIPAKTVFTMRVSPDFFGVLMTMPTPPKAAGGDNTVWDSPADYHISFFRPDDNTPVVSLKYIDGE